METKRKNLTRMQTHMRVDTETSDALNGIANSKPSYASHENSQESPEPFAPLMAIEGNLSPGVG